MGSLWKSREWLEICWEVGRTTVFHLPVVFALPSVLLQLLLVLLTSVVLIVVVVVVVVVVVTIATVPTC